MFVSDRLVFMELQKTGGSHIRRLLKEYAGGEADGKHNRLRKRPVDKLVIGSIRNPWDWYVSLWAYGVSGKGALRSRIERSLDFNYYNRMLPKAMGKNWISPWELLISLKQDLVKPSKQWQKTYKDTDDPSLFQDWLKLLFDKKRRFDFGEGFGFSPLSGHAGLLTYRYFRLFTLGDHVFSDQRLSKSDSLVEYDAEYNITEGMIRQESLEEDFVHILCKAGYSLSDKQLASILNKEGGKTNISKRKSASYYYDEETIELVAKRDDFIIKKYGYKLPF